jgi:methionine synthase II (cobalamin-independent)
MLAQAAVGIAGVTPDGDARLRVDQSRFDAGRPITVDLEHDAFTSLRTFLEVAKGRHAPVKWQATGPVTLGLALLQAGLPERTAFAVAARAVRTHLRTVHDAVTAALPGCAQVVMIDEPGLAGMLRPGFPLAPDAAVDLSSGALAEVEQSAMAGLHCCGDGDVAAILAAGPGILSLPATASVVSTAGYLATFLEGGGWVAWGAVPTDRPVGSSPEKWWKDLAGLWCELVQGGCDAIRLRTQALVTPACGLALHDTTTAATVLTMVQAIADRVHGQAVATRLSIGA